MRSLACRAVANPTTRITTQRLESGAHLALIGAIANIVLASIKITAGVVGHCYALIADGIESTVDIFSSLIIWFGLKVAAEPPDAEHPYGHGKAEPVAAIVVSFLLIVAALGIAVQSVREILTPHHAPAPFTLVVLVVVVLVKEVLFRKVLDAGEQFGSAAVKTDAWHHRSDAITSGAAFVGIVIALIGGPGWEPADDWAALLACSVIGYNGWRFLLPALREAMDTAPSKELEDTIRSIAAAVPGVLQLDQCRIRKMGLEFYVDLHVGVEGALSVTEGHAIAHSVKDAIRSAKPEIADVLVHIEPATDAPSIHP
jgi:cation diffusion facilitator family transporter